MQNGMRANSSEMIILYDWAPNDMPVFTEGGYMPRLEWLEKEIKRLESHGRLVELKKMGMQCMLKIDNKYNLNRA